MTDLRQYLLERVGQVDTPCWSWRGYRNKHGYPIASHADYKGYAHRMAYELLLGPIPEGLELHHKCFNRSCINPEHLEPVTRRENMDDSRGPQALNAKKTHCDKGHPFDEENTGFSDRNGGKKSRYCRTCKRETEEKNRRGRGAIPRDQWRASVRGKTHCKHGHELTEGNTVLSPAGYRLCKTCRNARARDAKRAKGAVPWAERLAAQTHCKNGHEFTPENTYAYVKDGKDRRSCRVCARERAAARRV